MKALLAVGARDADAVEGRVDEFVPEELLERLHALEARQAGGEAQPPVLVLEQAVGRLRPVAIDPGTGIVALDARAERLEVPGRRAARRPAPRSRRA